MNQSSEEKGLSTGTKEVARKVQIVEIDPNSKKTQLVGRNSKPNTDSETVCQQN